MYLLKLLYFNTTCKPICLTMCGDVLALLQYKLLLNICTRWC